MAQVTITKTSDTVTRYTTDDGVHCYEFFSDSEADEGSFQVDSIPAFPLDVPEDVRARLLAAAEDE